MIDCPILNTKIDKGECVAIIDVVDGVAKQTILPQKITATESWKEICRECKYHEN